MYREALTTGRLKQRSTRIANQAMQLWLRLCRSRLFAGFFPCIIALPRADGRLRMAFDLDADFPPATVPSAICRVVTNQVLDAEVACDIRIDAREFLDPVRGVHATSGLVGDHSQLLHAHFVGSLFILKIS